MKVVSEGDFATSQPVASATGRPPRLCHGLTGLSTCNDHTLMALTSRRGIDYQGTACGAITMLYLCAFFAFPSLYITIGLSTGG
jgi:hypothetical protein